MTDAATARRLLALLLDAEAVESEPIAEVRADLAALGEESAGVVAMARLLAAGAVSPATTLLAKIDESEQDVQEVGSAQYADIAAVQRIFAAGELLGAGIPPADVARAPRASDHDSNVVQLRRRSRRVQYGLGAIAASLALFIIFNFNGPGACQWGAAFLPKSWCVSQSAIVALLIVDPKLAPAALKDAKLPPGDLADRLAEAHIDAKDRQLVALLSVRQPDGRVSDSALLADIDLVLRTVDPVDSPQSLPEPRPEVLSALEEIIGPLPRNLRVIDLAHR